MKKSKILVLLLNLFVIAAIISGCKKSDPCDKTYCLNGGVCFDGSCKCPDGYTGVNCETKKAIDPCAGITCQNGGYCVNGTCNCPDGYTGSDCSQQKTPVKIKVTKIEVTKIPLTTSNGGGWDISNGPDLYVKITSNGNTIWEAPSYLPDFNSNSGAIFTPSNAYITSINDEHIVELWDYDTPDTDDVIGGIRFTPSKWISGFPKIITLDCSDCRVAYKLYCEYQF